MPYKPFWLQRLPEIVAALSRLSTDVVDRADFQTIFQVRRRRAIELMHSFGSHRNGRGYVLDRAVLLERLKSLELTMQYRWEEHARPDLVIEQIKSTKLQVGSDGNGGIHLRRSVSISFSNKRELARKLLELLRVACDDTGNQPVEQPAPHRVQYAQFERAIQLLQERDFSQAQGGFAQACVGPDQSISAASEMYLEVCRRRTDSPCGPPSFDECYEQGLALLNGRQLAEAAERLDSALRLRPDADYVYYALAVCWAAMGDVERVYSNLKRAIELKPRNRVAALYDPALNLAVEHTCVRQLLGVPVEKTGAAVRF
jgi:hypothetical protein